MLSYIFPACFVEFPVNVEGRSAAFFLAAEEFLAAEMPQDNYAFFWQLNPTCVFGRNQDPAKELDIDFCRAHGVELVRRKSGGGTIFADHDNIMTSLVTGGGAVEPVFEAFAHTMADGLRRLGAPTRVSGRNDICFDDGRKICGSAFYHLPDRNIVHCTMLYDTQMELMTGCLTPARAKLESKGVKSVSSRIGLLKEYFSFGADELRRRLRDVLCNRSIMLTEEQVRRIEELERPYHETEYLMGRKAETAAENTRTTHINGCGRIDLAFTLREGCIDALSFRGDYFEVGSRSAESAFREALLGVPYSADAVRAALSAHRPEQTVRGLKAEDVVALLFDNRNTN